MVFYLKYRPKTVEELDNAEIAALITRYLSLPTIPHAFLFTGPKGIGKTSTARILAKSINCTSSKKKGVACGICDVCISISKGDHLDVLEIDAASNRGIDEIRDLREKIKLTPTSLPYKVYIIDEVHMLTTEAFNALLKTLEEPPAHAVFILATTEIHKVPETILSRCIRVEFSRATESELVHSLKRICVGEGIEATDEALVEIAKLADGAFRDGAKLLEEISIGEKKITLKQVLAKMGVSDIKLQQTFLTHLRAKDTKELLVTIQKLQQEGKNIRVFFLGMLKTLEQELLQVISGKSDWKKEELLPTIEALARAFADLKTAVIPALPFELALIDLTLGSYNKQNQTVVVTPKAPNDISSGVPTAVSAVPLAARWNEFLETVKPRNNSIAGVLRSCRVLSLENNILIIEALYKFHAERLGEPKSHDIIAQVVKVEIVLKKR